MKKSVFILLTVALFSGALQTPAQTADSLKSPLQLTDIYDMEMIGNPQISPDGSRIIYERSFSDIMTDRNYSNLWILRFLNTNISCKHD